MVQQDVGAPRRSRAKPRPPRCRRRWLRRR
jgi:hypothetical protein